MVLAPVSGDDDIKERDNYTCQLCGRQKKPYRRLPNHEKVYFGRAEALEVHHIVPRKQGGSNDPENLVTVCRRCHQERIHNDHGDIIIDMDEQVWYSELMSEDYRNRYDK